MLSFDTKIKIKPANYLAQKRGLGINQEAQRFMDSEVLKRSSPLVPFDTGLMQGSGTRATKIGTGEVSWDTPYARRQYYTNKGQGLRGAKWFERMKAQHKESLLKGAAELTGGKVE